MKLYSHMSAKDRILSPIPFSKENVMESYLIDNIGLLKLDGDDEIILLGSQQNWLRGGNKGGRIDLLAVYNKDSLAIVEIKKGDLTCSDLEQLKSYFNVESVLNEAATFAKKQVEGLTIIKDRMGILVGTGMAPDLYEMVSKASKVANSKMFFVIIILKKYRLDNEHLVTSDVYALGRRPRNKDKFEVNGKVLPKNRFLLAVIHKYMEKNKNATVHDILEYFKDLHYGINLIYKYEDALKYSDEKGYSYFFLDEREAILINDTLYAVNNSCTKTEVPKLKDHASKLGLEFKQVK